MGMLESVAKRIAGVIGAVLGAIFHAFMFLIGLGFEAGMCAYEGLRWFGVQIGAPMAAGATPYTPGTVLKDMNKALKDSVWRPLARLIFQD